MKTIWFDMDGTIANLYAVENWLPKLRAEDPTPYLDADAMWDMGELSELLNQAQVMGYKLGIISWASKGGSVSYNAAVKRAKIEWLKAHMANVNWDSIYVVAYGTPKSIVMNTEDDILFDDEEKNRDNWLGQAFEPNDIEKVLKHLLGRGW